MTRQQWDEIAQIRRQRKLAKKGSITAWYRAHVRKVAEVMRTENARRAA